MTDKFVFKKKGEYTFEDSKPRGDIQPLANTVYKKVSEPDGTIIRDVRSMIDRINTIVGYMTDKTVNATDSAALMNKACQKFEAGFRLVIESMEGFGPELEGFRGLVAEVKQEQKDKMKKIKDENKKTRAEVKAAKEQAALEAAQMSH